MSGSDCEALADGFLAQPANAVSSLAYVAAAASVLVLRRRAGGIGRWHAAAAAALAGVGAGSFAFHGPQPPWAGPAHDGSIALLLAVLLPPVAAVPAAPVVAAVAGGAAVAAVVAEPGWAVPVHGVLAAAVGAVGLRRVGELRLPAAAAAAAGAGAVLLALGRTGGPLCAPASPLQAHAGWHVLSATAVALVVHRWPAEPLARRPAPAGPGGARRWLVAGRRPPGAR